jgi:AraC-like DNA-binding protein
MMARNGVSSRVKLGAARRSRSRDPSPTARVREQEQPAEGYQSRGDFNSPTRTREFSVSAFVSDSVDAQAPASLFSQNGDNWPAGLADEVAAELSKALMNSRSRSSASEYTRRGLIALLCNRLAGPRGSNGRGQTQNGVAFDEWQLRVISAAFVSLESRVVSLAGLSCRCQLSECHFARKFKLTYGMPLHRYVVKLRIERARHLLSETQESISQVALRCGFTDQSSFTRRFSSVMGVSPAHWRRQWIAPKLPIEREYESRERDSEENQANV